MHQTALDSAALRVQAEQIADAYLPASYGKAAFLEDPDKVQLLLASLQDGNYRETACRIAGIAKATLYNTLKRAETGDVGAQAFVDAVEKAEAIAESATVRNVRKASELPQFWAAGMTWLERKSPDKWGRRNEDSSAPKIVVQIGVKDGDVQVSIAPSPPTFAPTCPEVAQSNSLIPDTFADPLCLISAVMVPSESAPIEALAAPEVSVLSAGRTVAHPRRSRAGKPSQEVPVRKRRPGGLRKKKGAGR